MKHNETQNKEATSDDKPLVFAAYGYAGVALVGAMVSIAGNLRAEFLGHVPDTTVVTDFLSPLGWGTGISPSLLLISLVITIASFLVIRIGPLTIWRWLLAVGGILFAIGQLGEPHTYQILAGQGNFTILHILLVLAMILTPGVMAAIGIRAALRSTSPIN